MRVLIFSPGDDVAGVGIALKRALERHTHIGAVSVTRTQNYIAYPQDVFWPAGEPVSEAMQRVFDDADVVHLMQTPHGIDQFRGWESKRYVLHHHGTILRRHSGALRRWAAEHGARQLSSTPDLLLVAPESEWLPNPADVRELRRIRAAATVDTDIVQTPSSRHGKATAVLEAAVERMAHRPSLLVADRLTHAESLAAKARGRVCFDQMSLGYGVSGIEAMAMGIPVVGGASGDLLTAVGVPEGRHLPEFMLRMWGYLPFMLATPENLHERLSDVRGTAGALVREAGDHHIAVHHDEAVVARRLARLYDEVAA